MGISAGTATEQNKKKFATARHGKIVATAINNALDRIEYHA
jgi:hypothetical protein